MRYAVGAIVVLRDGSVVAVRERPDALRALLDGRTGRVGVTTEEGPRWLALADVVDVRPPPAKAA